MPFQSINTPDQNLQLIQGNISKVIQPLENVPMVNGNLLLAVTLLSGQDNLIQHGLDHTPTIFFIGNLNTNSVIWSPTTASLFGASASRNVINLWCSANCTVAIWVN